MKLFRERPELLIVAIAALLPILDHVLPPQARFTASLRPIFIFALLGLGLNIVTGLTGLLHLGVAAFMAIGAYTYGIFTCDIYPFRLDFWLGLLLTAITGAGAGFVLGLPTLRLRGDYLAIVTMGFGEIVQDLLRNLDTITKGTEGINPLPAPHILGFQFSSATPAAWYYLLLGLVLAAATLNRNLLMSRVGRAWLAVREDELAASCAGLPTVKIKLQAFALGAALCSVAGGLWASQLGSTGEPGNYDFQLSTIVLCIVIVGGLGSIAGVLIGALIMIGFNSIILVKISEFMMRAGISSTTAVYTSPSNWKYFVFGLALVLMMRFRPQGIIPEQHYSEDDT